MLFPGSSASGLIGIARLAAESELLEAKSQVRYFEIEARSILNRTRPGMPFEWTINPYRGCEFACRYCYARYTHEYMGMEDSAAFEDKIYAKAAAPGILRRELRHIDKAAGIAIGTATDPYQPAERRFGRTRAILEVFAEERGRRLSITTKSDLVARDIPLLREVARRNVLDINITITTLDAPLARLLEPRAPRPDLRLATVASLARAGICVGVFPNPVMPWLTDTEESLDALAAAVRAAGAQYMGGGPLFLMPCSRKVFFPFLEQHFPQLAEPYRKLYAKNARLGGRYKEDLRRRIRAIRERHGLASAPVDYKPELADEAVQLTLFE
ncbi:MAG TPA: radical SAM protein [Bryobacteraceae bacterium]|nr:radical SAM protein [Bryobacteraceae bacterium]